MDASITSRKHPLPKWSPHFTLSGLFVFIGACAVALTAIFSWQRLIAQRNFDMAMIVFDASAEGSRHETPIQIYCRTSKQLCEAECRLLFSDERAAKRAHLLRLDYLRLRIEAMAQYAIMGDETTPDDLFLKQSIQEAEHMADDL